MALGPYGVPTEKQKSRSVGLYTPMYEWPASQAEFRDLLDRWMDEVQNVLWPVWGGNDWAGPSAAGMEAATRQELMLAVDLYHGRTGPDILDLSPVFPGESDRTLRSHRWHYEIEDARVLDQKYAFIELEPGETPSFDYRASSLPGSNFLDYDPSIDIKQFEGLFWGRLQGLLPPVMDVKLRFQRLRPWMAATALNVEGFRWVAADGITHTGMHPAIPSGHCMQGILGGCSVFEVLLEQSRETGTGLTANRIKALQKYMVDWGDRRVFAGVHFMTDNIASWVLLRRLIPRLFRNPAQVETFAVQAILQHSQVFADILDGFRTAELAPARDMLLRAYPEAPAA